MGTACELYSIDHDGKYPSASSQLAPSYLKTLPVCPTSKRAYWFQLDQKGYKIVCPGNHEGAGVGNIRPHYDERNGLGPRIVEDRAKALAGKEAPGPACKSNLKIIANALYRWSYDHQGRYPNKLGALAPKYIEAVPECPRAKRDTYSTTYKSGTDAKAFGFFRLYCRGHHHKADQYRANYPAYSSQEGIE